MKIIYLFIFSMLLSFAAPTRAESGKENANSNSFFKNSNHSVDIGLYISSKKYREEEGSFMEDKAFLQGIHFMWQYHKEVFAAFELNTAFGKTNYSNPSGGKANGISETLTELRFLLGHDIWEHNSLLITGYLGYGYRRLNMDGTGVMTAPNTYLYDRIANYYYLPIGIKFKKINENLIAEFIAEFDHLIKGLQESYLSQVNSWYPDFKNLQNTGYGLKAKLNLEKEFSNTVFIFTPFVNYWKVQQSQTVTKLATDPSSGITYILSVNEPRNDSLEWGLQVSIKL